MQTPAVTGGISNGLLLEEVLEKAPWSTGLIFLELEGTPTI